VTEPQFDLDVTLSLFDGISCGQEALKRAGISTRIFLASEIEKYPKMITRKNHPLTVQLGDVTKIESVNLPPINLLMGGSPCQGFSFAGKQLNFDDPRSALFFEFVRLLKECKPDYFLLENVMMKQEYQDIISEHLGVKPVMINSALVSAQNRKRLYWTNIPGVSVPDDLQINLVDVLEEDATEPMLSNIYGGFNEKKPRVHTGKSVTIRAASGGGHIPSVTLKQPKDKGILLKDILEDGIADIVTNQGKTTHKQNIDKAACLLARDYKGFGNQGMTGVRPCELKKFNTNAECHHAATATDINGHDSIKRVYAETGKSPTLTTMGGGHREPKVLIVPEATKKGYTEIEDGDCFDATFINSKTRRGRNMKDKSNCLTAANFDYMRYEHPTYRKLTPIECERLQTLPDNYTEGVSNTQRYKGLGNGWTVDVIVHILQGIKVAA